MEGLAGVGVVRGMEIDKEKENMHYVDACISLHCIYLLHSALSTRDDS